MYWILAGLILFFLLGLRKLQLNERALVLRFGKSTKRIVGPGIFFVMPFVDSLQCISIDALSLSLPIQSAITRDEIPIQLQASLDAELQDLALAITATKDWRVYLISKLQDLMKDKLEELDFDDIDSRFPAWVQSIRNDLDDVASAIGARITGLSISNLSPRTRPESN